MTPLPAERKKQEFSDYMPRLVQTPALQLPDLLLKCLMNGKIPSKGQTCQWDVLRKGVSLGLAPKRARAHKAFSLSQLSVATYK